MSISKVSRLLDISRPTLYKWQHQLEDTGSTVPKTTVPPPEPSKITDWLSFQEFVERHGDKTQQEMAQLWGNVSRHTISRGLKKLGYTRKKKPMLAQERSEEARCLRKRKASSVSTRTDNIHR
jgi:transposase